MALLARLFWLAQDHRRVCFSPKWYSSARYVIADTGMRDDMDIKPIKTKADYRAALKKVEKLMGAKAIPMPS